MIVQTEVVPCSLNVSMHPFIGKRVAIRLMSDDDFIEKHASGTLRKNKRLGFIWKTQYYHERASFEFGWGFESVPRSYVMFGDPITEGDSKPVTEAGWFIDRYLSMSIFAEDYFEAKNIVVDDKAGNRREGIGLIVRQTSAPWIPKGHIVFCIIAEYHKEKGWLPAVNPS